MFGPPRCANSRGRDRPPEGVIDVPERSPYAVNNWQLKNRTNEHSPQTDRQATQGVEVVYYLRLPDGLIKIGTSRRALERLSTHRRKTGVDEVLAVEFGGRDLERQRHEQFAAEREGRREHFTASDALMSHIQSLRDALGLSA